MSEEVKQLIEFAIQDLVAEVVEREHLSIKSAMQKLYHSEFYTQLTNPEFGLYRESGEYLYHAFLAQERFGKRDKVVRARVLSCVATYE